MSPPMAGLFVRWSLGPLPVTGKLVLWMLGHRPFLEANPGRKLGFLVFHGGRYIRMPQSD